MSGAKEKYGLPSGVWLLVGGLLALMVGYMLGGVLTTTTALDFLLPRAALPVSVVPNSAASNNVTQNSSVTQNKNVTPHDAAPANARPNSAKPNNVELNNAAPFPVTAVKPPAQAPTSAQPPSAPAGKIVLQVAALRRGDHARALANTLKQKGFPAFVKAATADNLYRVQVGPYTDRPLAQATALALKRQGFPVYLRPQ